jgi:anti-sigma regulatory factor (Ser/Thr protein kinase)
VVRTTFDRWGLSVLIADVELAVSELVTKAVKHGLPPVILTLRQRVGHVTADVSDTRPETSSREWPTLSNAHDESGRGRGIIAAVSDRSGTQDNEGQGKSAYASWDVDPHTPSDG